jgi:predicted CXXCH cytochrome family protein
VGNVPSQHVTIPKNFPLDDQGRMQCSTCHTPHAVSFEEGMEFAFFLRSVNKDSSFCKECHVEKIGGPDTGNHPIDVSAKKVPDLIIKAGGIMGKSMPDQIICETCHTPHGGVNNQRLVLSVEDPLTRWVLCEVCHTKSPDSIKNPGVNRFSHPLDISPDKAVQIPQKWTCGEDVVLGKGGVLVCRTCHKPHQAIEKKVLLADRNTRDSMCGECHRGKENIAGSSHDLKVSAPNDKNIQGKQAAEIGVCSPCHLVHQGAARYMWAQPLKNPVKTADDFCTSCHARGASAEKKIPGDFSHPIGIKATPQATSKLLPLADERGNRAQDGLIRCFSCHDVHNPAPLYTAAERKEIKHGKFLRLSKSQPSEVCIACHKEQGSIQGTDHDVRITSQGYKNVLNQNQQTGGLCSPCHVAHNAPQKKFLWSAPLGPARLDTWKDKIGDYHDSFMIQTCTGCHAPGKNAEKKVPVYAFHPGALTRQVVLEKSSTDMIYYDLVNNAFPIYTDEGEFKEGGYIVCSTCHNPHVWKKSAEKGPGKAVEGGASDSFLRVDVVTQFCIRCHGEESLAKHLYFHTELSRVKKEIEFLELEEIR